jgi:hypothetical protein
MGRSLVQPEGHPEYNDVTAKASVMRRFYRVVRECPGCFSIRSNTAGIWRVREMAVLHWLRL